MEKVIINKENIEKTIQQGATSISQVYKILGGKGNVSGNTAKKIRELCPDIAERLDANKNKPTDKPGVPTKASSPATPAVTPAKSDKPTKAATAVKRKQPKEPKPVKKSKYPRHPQNPYRIGSNYGLAFDVLAAHKNGIGRDELINLIRKENGKDVKHTLYDLSVVLSPSESVNGPRHRSAKNGYFVQKEYHHYKLILP